MEEARERMYVGKDFEHGAERIGQWIEIGRGEKARFQDDCQDGGAAFLPGAAGENSLSGCLLSIQESIQP